MRFSRKRSALATLLLAFLLMGLMASTQNAATPDLQVTDDAGYDQQIVDANGMTVYVLLQDEDGQSTCVGACTNNWPPLVADGEPVIGEGLDPELVGTTERPDGTLQLTYAGRPLYTYARDSAPGDVNGQGLGNLFYVLAASGEVVTGPPGVVVAELDDDVMAALMAEGERIFASHCAACHGAGGEGVIAPQLADNSNLGRTSFVVARMMNGYIAHGMPAFRDVLDDRQFSAVLTFLRNSWENDYGPVTEEEVSELR